MIAIGLALAMPRWFCCSCRSPPLSSARASPAIADLLVVVLVLALAAAGSRRV